ncbi:MAG: family 20 glycosylhydrolase [Pseudomonadales bacterium]
MSDDIDPSLDLLPQPAQVDRTDGPGLAKAVRLEPVYAGHVSARLERAVARALTATGRGDGGAARPLTVDCPAAAAALPALDDDESYRLEIGVAGVHLAAPQEWGVLRGLATLSQLVAAPGPLPALRIVDAPRFPWRGLMLDVARHFIPLDDLLRTVEAMALFKLNVLHLHLSDDQAFRFPSRRFPRLPGTPHYRAAELERLVQAAADRGIRVVPELDVPGHTASWLTAYPEWGNRPARATRRFGVHRECLDPTRAAVRAAVAALFEELAETFPDAYVHFGGDEVHPDWWAGDSRITAYRKRRGLADGAALQADFTAHVAAALSALGRIPLGWDEVLHPQLPAAVAVQAWRGASARDRALAAGHDCVFSAPYYLDLHYPSDVHMGFDPAAPEAELAQREDALLQDPRFAHVAAGMAWTRQWRDVAAPAAPPRPRGRLLGAEACLWSELVDARVLDVRLWSRMPALAERFWSTPGADRGADDLRRRLAVAHAQLPRLAGVDVAGDVDRGLRAAGVDAAWRPLVELLEPVKWYGRLLGEEALAARLQGREMPQARPYDADTPLDRVVDVLPPESAAAQRIASLLRAEASGDPAARRRLRALAEGWRELPAAAGPEELAAAAAALRDVGDVVLGELNRRADRAGARPDAGPARRRLAAAAGPFGEYLLAPVPALLDWLERRDATG